MKKKKKSAEERFWSALAFDEENWNWKGRIFYDERYFTYGDAETRLERALALQSFFDMILDIYPYADIEHAPTDNLDWHLGGCGEYQNLKKDIDYRVVPEDWYEASWSHDLTVEDLSDYSKEFLEKEGE